MKRRILPAVETRLQKRRRQDICLLDELWTDEIMAWFGCRENMVGLRTLVRIARTCKKFYHGPWRRHITFFGGEDLTWRLTDTRFLPFAPYLKRFEYFMPCVHLRGECILEDPTLMACIRLTHLKFAAGGGCTGCVPFKELPPGITHLDLQTPGVEVSSFSEMPSLRSLTVRKGIYPEEEEEQLKGRLPRHVDFTLK
jgi:hypothetical protein